MKHVSAHKLPNLLPDHLERMYRKMQDSGSSASTANQVHRTVRTALNEAVVRGYLAKNPALIAKPPQVDEEEIEDFHKGTLAVAVQRPRSKWQHGCGGACGHKHAGHCPQRMNTRKETAKPKSKAGRRTIGLPQPLLDQLRLHVIEQGKERKKPPSCGTSRAGSSRMR